MGWVASYCISLVAGHAEFLVGSIEGLCQQSGISESFVGLILLPIIGNAAGKKNPPAACIEVEL